MKSFRSIIDILAAKNEAKRWYNCKRHRFIDFTNWNKSRKAVVLQYVCFTAYLGG